MYFTKKWDEIMGPKDERLVAEENKSSKVAMNILMVGAILALYYAVSLQQVADVTDHPLLTSLSEYILPIQALLTITILVASMVLIASQTKAGYFSTRTRFAEVDRIPWDFVALMSVACGLAVGVLSCLTRMVAEIQIVGFENIMWFGDIAIGVVFFMMAFALCFIFTALTIHDAIKRRQELERELEQ